MSGNKEFEAWAATNVAPTNDGPKIPESTRIQTEIDRARLELMTAQMNKEMEAVTAAAVRLNDLTERLVVAIRNEEKGRVVVDAPRGMESTRNPKERPGSVSQRAVSQVVEPSLPMPPLKIEVVSAPRPVPEDDCRRDLISAARDIVAAKRVSEMDAAVKMMRTLCDEWGEREPKWEEKR